MKTSLTMRVILDTTPTMMTGRQEGNLKHLIFTQFTGFLSLKNLILAAVAVLSPQYSVASFEDELQIQIFQYASENSPTFYLSNGTTFHTNNFLSRVDGYFESGAKGAWSLDPDPVRYHWFFADNEKDFIWFGREHPLNLTRTHPLDPRGALGSAWVQNQLEALAPKVSGWVGMGLRYDLDPKWTLVMSYSPLFLPTFGPSLGFSERGDLNPSRFARLPPANVTTAGITVPIRYQLKLDQLSELLLQHQAFIGIAHDDEVINMDAYIYTAPKPDPIALTGSNLAVSSASNSVNADVDISPQFPRETWMGGQIQIKTIPYQPSFEILQSLNDLEHHVISATGYFESPQINPLVVKRNTRASFGLVTHLHKQFVEPKFTDLRVYIRVPIDITHRITWRTLLELTLMKNRESGFWLNELEYAIEGNFSVIAAVRILSGKSDSYFGDWRSHDSYSGGIKWIF